MKTLTKLAMLGGSALVYAACGRAQISPTPQITQTLSSAPPLEVIIDDGRLACRGGENTLSVSVDFLGAGNEKYLVAYSARNRPSTILSMGLDPSGRYHEELVLVIDQPGNYVLGVYVGPEGNINSLALSIQREFKVGGLPCIPGI